MVLARPEMSTLPSSSRFEPMHLSVSLQLDRAVVGVLEPVPGVW